MEKITYLHQFEDQLKDVIIQYFPNFTKENIQNIARKGENILFEYEGNHYVCFAKKPRSIEQMTQQAVLSPWFYLKNLVHFMEQGPQVVNNITNINQKAFEKFIKIICSYYQDLDTQEIYDIKLCENYIVFRYYSGIYSCPTKHYFALQNKINIAEYTKNLGEIILSHYPDIPLQHIQDIRIENGQILFQLIGELCFCSFIHHDEELKAAEVARKKELELELYTATTKSKVHLALVK